MINSENSMFLSSSPPLLTATVTEGGSWSVNPYFYFILQMEF